MLLLASDEAVAVPEAVFLAIFADLAAAGAAAFFGLAAAGFFAAAFFGALLALLVDFVVDFIGFA